MAELKKKMLWFCHVQDNVYDEVVYHNNPRIPCSEQVTTVSYSCVLLLTFCDMRAEIGVSAAHDSELDRVQFIFVIKLIHKIYLDFSTSFIFSVSQTNTL